MIEYGRHFVGQASEGKQTEKLKKQFGMLQREAKILENKNASFQIPNLKKEIETLRIEAEMRKNVVERMENGKLTQMQLANVLGKLEKMKLWMTRTGETYHNQNHLTLIAHCSTGHAESALPEL